MYDISIGERDNQDSVKPKTAKQVKSTNPEAAEILCTCEPRNA